MNLEKLGPRWLEIDLDQLSANIELIQKKVGKAQIIPVVKANAYGHGLCEISKHLEKIGLGMIAVMTIEEAKELRDHFFKGDILVLANCRSSQMTDILNYNLTPTICDLENAILLNDLARKRGQVQPLHLYVDTGMGRMGHPLSEFKKIYPAIADLKNTKIDYIYTHFPVSDEDDEDSRAYTLKQWSQLSLWAKELSPCPSLHLANSGAVLFHQETYESAVRPGLLCYGVSPDSTRVPKGFKPVMSIHCKPLSIKRLEAGSHIGYGRDFLLHKASFIATLPVGYADGFARRLSGKLEALIGKKIYPIVGRICMDTMMVNLGDDEISTEDEVTLMGKGAKNIYEMSLAADCIPYEFLTTLGRRWSRAYFKKGELYHVDSP